MKNTTVSIRTVVYTDEFGDYKNIFTTAIYTPINNEIVQFGDKLDSMKV